MDVDRSRDSNSSWIEVVDFGLTQAGEKVTKFTFGNANGYEVEMLSYGATVHSIKTPDRDRNYANITLNCEDISGYEANEAYLGATVGPFCNRICGANFTLEGEKYQLAANDGSNTLHGGRFGFNQKVWAAEPIQIQPTSEASSAVGVRFSTTSPDGEDGFPGTVEVSVKYLLSAENELSIEFSATTDKATHINLTNHCYWNLSGDLHSTIYNHVVQIDADKILDMNDAGIPSGKLVSVAGTAFDFNEPKSVGTDIEHLTNTPQGYDHCYLVNVDNAYESAKIAVILFDPSSGRCLEISTDQPALQFYSSNFMDSTVSSGGHPKHGGIALETQGFPDAPNHDHFPSTLLIPGQDFRSKTVIKFSVK